ncbi:MAG: mechanosensitive ion channel family protein [Chitinophagales bacterium]
MENLNIDFGQLTAVAIQYGTKLLLTLLVLLIGLSIVKAIVNGLDKLLTKQKMDATLKPVIVSTASMLLKVMLILAIAATLGIKTTSFIAVLGAATLGVSMALQGSLGNFAGGVLILFFRPFSVGDYIKAQGAEGFVKEIQLFVTILNTPDNVTVYLPNGALAGGNITNVSQNGTVRLHLAIGIGYGEDIGKAKEILVNVMKNNKMVLNKPAPEVAVVNLGDNSVDLDMRPWCNAGDAPAVTVSILESAKVALDKAGVDIPYPQQVVHHINN